MHSFTEVFFENYNTTVENKRLRANGARKAYNWTYKIGNSIHVLSIDEHSILFNYMKENKNMMYVAIGFFGKQNKRAAEDRFSQASIWGFLVLGCVSSGST